jgi:hypothetical protein
MPNKATKVSTIISANDCFMLQHILTLSDYCVLLLLRLINMTEKWRNG